MAANRRPGTGRAGRSLGTGRPKAAEPTSRTAGLTSRAAVLGLVFCALVVSAALPLREYLSQRAVIVGLEQQQQAARDRVAALEDQKAKLQDPAYVAGLARDRLHFVRPGETAYVVIATSEPPRDATAATRAAEAAIGPQAPWYSQLWGSVRSADRPVQVRTDK